MIKGSFPISKVLVFEGNSYVCGKNEDIRLFWWLQMVKNLIEGSFPMSKVLVFEGNRFDTYFEKNEDIRQFYDCTW